MMTFFFCGVLCLQHHGTISANIESFQKTGQRCSVDLISSWNYLPGLSLPSLSSSGKKSKSELKKWTASDMRHPISLYAFGSVRTQSLKSEYFFLRKKFKQTHFKFSQASSFWVNQTSLDFSYLSSHEDAFFQFCSDNFVKFVLRHWNLLNLSYLMAFNKHLINSSFMSRGGRNIFIGLTRGWTLSFPGA